MTANQQDFGALVRAVQEFRDDRDWAQFHTPKDLAISVSIEAAELLEHFQWKSRADVDAALGSDAGRAAIADEMADVLLLLVSLGEATGIELLPAAFRKLAHNAEKYPVEKARGSATKYDQL
jgi:dCTP diphosphatase